MAKVLKLLKSLPSSLCQREEKYIPLLTKSVRLATEGDIGGLDNLFQRDKIIWERNYRDQT